MPSFYTEKPEVNARRDVSVAEPANTPAGKRQLTGPERAAVLMLALGEQHGGKIWSMLDDEELRQISAVMSTIGIIEAELVESLLLEFVSRMSASGALMGNFDATERLLQQYLPPERVGNIMDEIRGPAGRNMWEKLSNVQEGVLANYLKNEYPQTVAVVLSKIGPEHAARVLAILPEELALDVVNRMLRMEAVQKEVLERVEQTLRTEFMSNLSQTRRRDAHEVMAEIFNNVLLSALSFTGTANHCAKWIRFFVKWKVGEFKYVPLGPVRQPLTRSEQWPYLRFIYCLGRVCTICRPTLSGGRPLQRALLSPAQSLSDPGDWPAAAVVLPNPARSFASCCAFVAMTCMPFILASPRFNKSPI